MSDITLLQFLAWLVPILTTAWVGYLFKRYEQYRKDNSEARKNKELEMEQERHKLAQQMDLLATAIQCMLRDKLLQSCRYYIKQGSIPLAVKVSLSNMYKAYTALHGNDVVTGVYHQMIDLKEDDNTCNNISIL